MSGDNGKLFGLDGKPLTDELVAPSGYLEQLGRRGGFSLQQREFLRANLPKDSDGPPEHLSRSQRMIYALRESLTAISVQNLQLWALVAALAERVGGELVFDKTALAAKMKPAHWPAVTVDPEGDVHVVMPVSEVGSEAVQITIASEPKGDVS